MTPARPQGSAERAEFEAAVTKYGNAVADIMESIPTGEPLPAAVGGIAAYLAVLAIFDRVLQRAELASDRRVGAAKALEYECNTLRIELAAAVERAEKYDEQAASTINGLIERAEKAEAERDIAVRYRDNITGLHAEVTALTEQRDALRAACERWAAIASGEIQVADDDSEGMGVLYNEIRAALAPRETEGTP